MTSRTLRDGGGCAELEPLLHIHLSDALPALSKVEATPRGEPGLQHCPHSSVCSVLDLGPETDTTATANLR